MNKRYELIKEILESSDSPVTASVLAERMSVSRQIIVGDIALLRAGGADIIATSRGYLLNKEKSKAFEYTGIIPCQHGAEQLKDELYTIVDFGGTVIDVSIEHSIYGEICGQLGLASRFDVDEFVKKVQESPNSTPISALTGGVHLHRIGCQSEDIFLKIKGALTDLGIVYK
ncbi:MAG: transcription repressor NadR [Firmicutes bacterium]|nr:transcription repressor NadR [Bacillota bacterium]